MTSQESKMRDRFHYFMDRQYGAWIRTMSTGYTIEDAWKVLMEGYGEPHREYHNWEHIEHCLNLLPSTMYYQNDRKFIEAALYFHDVEYDPVRKDNELRSAQLAFYTLRKLGIPWGEAKHVADLVLVTDHKTKPTTEEEKIIVDIDLAILGCDSEPFKEYEGKIRAEYCVYTDQEYAKGRLDVLNSFLDRVTIYHTEGFSRKFEERARNNICHSIYQLEEFLNPLRRTA